MTDQQTNQDAEVWTAPGTSAPAAEAPAAPPAWRAEILDATSVQALTAIHARYHSVFTTTEALNDFLGALTAQKHKLKAIEEADARAAAAPKREERVSHPSAATASRSISTAAPIIERLLDDHVTAIDTYQDAATAAARADADYKAEYAKRYLEHRSHAEVKTVAEAEYRTDSDPAVTEARFQRGVTEGLERAARFRVENIEKRLDYWRSVMVAERHLDESERSRR